MCIFQLESTSFMTLSPSSTGNLILGCLLSGIYSCLTTLNFWTTFSKSEVLLSDIEDTPSLFLGFLEYSFHLYTLTTLSDTLL